MPDMGAKLRNIRFFARLSNSYAAQCTMNFFHHDIWCVNWLESSKRKRDRLFDNLFFCILFYHFQTKSSIYIFDLVKIVDFSFILTYRYIRGNFLAMYSQGMVGQILLF